MALARSRVIARPRVHLVAVDRCSASKRRRPEAHCAAVRSASAHSFRLDTDTARWTALAFARAGFRARRAADTRAGPVSGLRLHVVAVDRCSASKRCRRPEAHCAAVRSLPAKLLRLDAARCLSLAVSGAGLRGKEPAHFSSSWTWTGRMPTGSGCSTSACWGADGSDTTATSSGSSGRQPLRRANITTTRAARMERSLLQWRPLPST